MSPISIVGIDGTLLPPRLFFPLEDSSRLILIIGIQSSSKPSPPLPPAGPRSAPPVPHPDRPPAAPLSETDSTIQPASKIPAATLPLIPALLPSLRPDKFSRCARPLRWPGRSQTSSEFP